MRIYHFQIAAIALICSSSDISFANSCELQTALESLHLSYTPSCKYNAIKEKTDDFNRQGLASLCCHGILCIFILCIYLWPSENKQIGFLITYVIVSTVLSFTNVNICGCTYLHMTPSQSLRYHLKQDKKHFVRICCQYYFAWIALFFWK